MYKAKGKRCAHLDRFYDPNNLATKPYVSKTYIVDMHRL